MLKNSNNKQLTSFSAREHLRRFCVSRTMNINTYTVVYYNFTRSPTTSRSV